MMLPVHLILAALCAQKELLEEVRAAGACDRYEERLLDLHEFNAALEGAVIRATDTEGLAQ